jgi:hypothetical protein
MARCPAHKDRRASLAISVGKDGRCLLHCHARCNTAAILSHLGLAMAALHVKQSASTPATGFALPVIDAGALIDQNPPMAEPIIEGLLRRDRISSRPRCRT